jgi:SAM-dependent methyltransferase
VAHGKPNPLPLLQPEEARYLVAALGYPAPDAALIGKKRLGSLSAALLGSRWWAGVNLIPHYVPDGRLLELGSGSGTRLRFLRALGWRDPQGIELSPAAAGTARGLGLDVRSGAIETELAKHEDRSLDAVIAAMVLEHLYDPFAIVELVFRKLKPGGQFLFSTVNRDSWDARWFGKYWRNLDLPRHMVWFTTADLKAMLREYTDIEVFHHAATIDFVGSAEVRRRYETRFHDRFFKHKPVRLLSLAGAMLAKTSRVSVNSRSRHA